MMSTRSRQRSNHCLERFSVQIIDMRACGALTEGKIGRATVEFEARSLLPMIHV